MPALKELFTSWITTRKLLRIEVVQAKMGRRSFAGRLLQYHEDGDLLLVYHEDEKKIYNFRVNEIDSIQPAADN